MKLINTLTMIMSVLIFYVLWCSYDVFTTIPVKTGIVSVIVTNDKMTALKEFDYTPDMQPIKVSRYENLNLVYEGNRYRNGRVKNERKILELNQTEFLVSTVEKHITPGHYRINIAVDIPNYIHTGCSRFFITSYYNYSYNLLTYISPVKREISSLTFCVVD